MLVKSVNHLFNCFFFIYKKITDFGKSSIYLFVPLYNIVLLLQEGDKNK